MKIDGALIYIQYVNIPTRCSDNRIKGIRTGRPDVLDALLAGEQVDPHRYDFHMHVFLETGDQRLPLECKS